MGAGFLEQVYQETLELEFKRQNIPYCREKELESHYKDVKLNKSYIADFILIGKIIGEMKDRASLSGQHES